MTAGEIVEAARSALDVPFLHQGRSLRGMDCAGLIIYVAGSLGLDYRDVAGYGRTPMNGLLESTLDSQICLERVTGGPAPGDVLLLRFTGDPQHLAIYTGENIIHSYLRVGKVCEHQYTDEWVSRTVRVYRFIGVEA